MAELHSAPTPVGADDKLRSAREQGLTVEIVDDRLVVSIGIDALMTVVRSGDGFDHETHVINDPDALAASIAAGLLDDVTAIHVAIDDAFLWTVDENQPGVAFVPEFLL